MAHLKPTGPRSYMSLLHILVFSTGVRVLVCTRHQGGACRQFFSLSIAAARTVKSLSATSWVVGL